MTPEQLELLLTEDVAALFEDCLARCLDSEGLTRLGIALGVPLRGEYGYTRDLILNSDEGRTAWKGFVGLEGWREDPTALKTRRLLMTFPSLRDKVMDGQLGLSCGSPTRVPAWSAREVERFACSPAAHDAARHAAAFVLSVWNPLHEYAFGLFSIHPSLKCWDDQHRHAFLAWVQDPWWA